MTILTFFGGCKNDIAKVNSLIDKHKQPLEQSFNMHLYYSVGGNIKYEFIFPKVNKYKTPETYLESPDGFEIIGYDEQHEKDVTLTAKYGVNYEDRKLMEAKNNVVITNFKKNEIIETEHLVWDMNKHIIYSNSQIKQTKSDGSVYLGQGFESDENLQKYTILKPEIIIYAEEK
jgi:LPS export ABC transporter protein LptC